LALQHAIANGDEPALLLNVSDLTIRLCDGEDGRGVTLENLEIVGDFCKARRFSNLVFKQCHFWQADLRDALFSECAFVDCEFGDIVIDRNTSFERSRLVNSPIASLEFDGDTHFAPTDIVDVLSQRGLTVEQDVGSIASQPRVRPVSREVLKVLNAFVKASTRSTDIAVEEMEEQLDRVAVRRVVKEGIKYDILKVVNKTASGRRKTFVRFGVDRHRLMQGVAGPVGDLRMDQFWNALEE
jgi:hypothetical protein